MFLLPTTVFTRRVSAALTSSFKPFPFHETFPFGRENLQPVCIVHDSWNTILTEVGANGEKVETANQPFEEKLIETNFVELTV